MKIKKPAIIVHGGAGEWPTKFHKPAIRGVRKAAAVGFEVLRRNGSPVDAVEAAVVSLEDNPLFNAGTGSTLNLLGEVETDAAIMDGENLQAGAVAVLKHIRNPVKAARVVMDQTTHVLIAGSSAEKLARKNGLPTADLRVPRRVKAWKDALRKMKSNREAFGRNPVDIFLADRSDTVGALAKDINGNLAAADSTGGTFLKLPGRIGDSPIIGAGLYADNRKGAATATGVGEQAIRLVLSKAACDLMQRSTAQEAAERTVRLASKSFGRGIGLLALDRNGLGAVVHNTRHLCWAMKDDTGIVSRMWGTRISKSADGEGF